MPSPATRDNVVALVDRSAPLAGGPLRIADARRAAEGQAFAFTGTPIESTDHSTQKAFAPENAHLRRWDADAQWRRLYGAGAVEDDVVVDEDSDLDLGEVRARRKFMESFKDASSHLKLLIVTDMLLTGFDAPVEQVMFLDKPLRGAKLLQAIMRTNRPYPERGKDRGVIIDYWGVFDRLQAAFAEFSPEDIEMLVAGMPKQDDYERMMWLLARFMNDKEAAELFEERFKAVQSAYETLAPDPSLVPHRRPCPRSGSPDQIEPALTVIPEASVRELDDLVEAAQSGA